MKLKPLNKHVLVAQNKPAEDKVNGIYIPDAAKEKPVEGTVINRGDSTLVSVNDKILYGKYAGTEIKLDGDAFLLLREEEILGVYEP